MSLFEIILIALGVSIDALAVSVSSAIGISKKQAIRIAIQNGIVFGFFQFLMPLIGFLVGAQLKGFFESFDHWVAFILLALVGGKMIHEAFSNNNEDKDKTAEPKIAGFKTLFILGIATSMDALAVGASLAMIGSAIMLPAILMGVVTLIMSMFGVGIGFFSSHFLGKKLDFLGGAVIVLIGIKILLEHLLS